MILVKKISCSIVTYPSFNFACSFYDWEWGFFAYYHPFNGCQIILLWLTPGFERTAFASESGRVIHVRLILINNCECGSRGALRLIMSSCILIVVVGYHYQILSVYTYNGRRMCNAVTYNTQRNMTLFPVILSWLKFDASIIRTNRWKYVRIVFRVC